MKPTTILNLILLLLVGPSCVNAQTKPEIDYIITNDYMSERNLSFMGGPITSTYKKGIVDSLQNSYVEFFEKGFLKEKRYYNQVGAQYQTNLYFYAAKDRVEKVLEIDEYFNDTTTYLHEYKDSADHLVQKTIITVGKKPNRLDLYYQWDTAGVNTVKTMYENGQLYFRDSIKNSSTKERRIHSYDSANRRSTYQYKYNDKELIVFEKTKKWDYVIRGDYFEVEEAFDYLFKYDAQGNWTERIKQTYCPPKKKQVTKKPATNKPKILTERKFEEECETELKEKLVRKIYYK